MENDILQRRLRNLRESRGYLQKFVADKIGVKSNTLSGYENGTRSPDPDMLIKLSDLYGVSIDYLLGHSDNPHPMQEERFIKFSEDPELQVFMSEDLPKSSEEFKKAVYEMWKVMERDNRKK